LCDWLHARAAEGIDDLQHGGGATGGSLGPAAQLGDGGHPALGGRTGRAGLGQQRGQETAGDGQADALGLGGAGKGGQGILVEKNGVVKQCLELGKVAAQGVQLLAECLELRRVVVLLEGVQESLGVAVEGLAGKALGLGASGDVAVGPVEDSGGIGDAKLGR